MRIQKGVCKFHHKKIVLQLHKKIIDKINKYLGKLSLNLNKLDSRVLSRNAILSKQKVS